MSDWLAPLIRTDTLGWSASLLSLVLAFTLAQCITGLYLWTFRGMSYSRTFVQSLPLASIVTCMLMLAVGSNLVAGIAVIGGLSIVRFRTTLRDPRDVVFVFAALAVGITSGLRAYSAALIGTLVFLGAAVLLHWTAYGARQQFDGLLRFVAPTGPDTGDAIQQVLREYTSSFVLVTLREAAQGRTLEHAYQVRVPDPARRGVLVAALQTVSGVEDVTFFLQEASLEL